MIYWHEGLPADYLSLACEKTKRFPQQIPLVFISFTRCNTFMAGAIFIFMVHTCAGLCVGDRAIYHFQKMSCQ